MSHTIVVSHYRENLDWLWTLPDDITKVIIYHKGNRLDLIPKNHPMVEVHTLPNIGREGHTILYHILANYKHWQTSVKNNDKTYKDRENFDDNDNDNDNDDDNDNDNDNDDKKIDRVTFVQGNPLEHSPYLINLFRVVNDWKPAQELGYQFDQSTPPPHVLQHFKNRGSESVLLGIDWNANHYLPSKWTDKGITYLQSKYIKQYHQKGFRVHHKGIIMDFLTRCGAVAICPDLATHDLIPMTYGGQFSVEITQILKRPIRLYQKLVEGLFITKDTQGGLEGYILERCWMLLFTDQNMIQKIIKD